MTSGFNWEYLNNLKNKFNASISILGSNSENIVLANEMNFDIIILETEKYFSESFYQGLIDLGCNISYKNEKDVSMVYSFRNSNGTVKACSYGSVDGELIDYGFVDGFFESRDLLNIAMNCLNNQEQDKSFVKTK